MRRSTVAIECSSRRSPTAVGVPSLCLLSALVSALVLAAASGSANAQQTEPAGELVREVAYNELHDHDIHGYWRYWVRQSLPGGSQLMEQVETSAGPVTRVLLRNGSPLDAQSLRVQQIKLEELVNSPAEQANRRQAYTEDERRVGRIMALLPDAFCFEDAGEENGIRHLHFHPNPSYPPHTIEARIFHALNGELWIDVRMKRLSRMEGRLDRNLNFGLGLLGRVNKGSWFMMQRRQVSGAEWKTEALEMHMSGRALLFKTIARETSEARGGFTPLPPGFNLAQGVRLLVQADAGGAKFDPVSLTGIR